MNARLNQVLIKMRAVRETRRSPAGISGDLDQCLRVVQVSVADTNAKIDVDAAPPTRAQTRLRRARS